MSNSKLLNKKDLIVYFLVAGTGVIIQLVCSSLFQSWFTISYEASITPSYFISLVVGFILTKLFAFNARKTSQTRREMVKYLIVATFSGGVTWFFATFSYRISNHYFEIFHYLIPFSKKVINVNQLTCHLIGNGFSFMSNYTLHKTFTFKDTGFYDRLKRSIL
ncbi:GtrA family protein [Arcicella sp. DC2W]|uniref:GtrA family protein n=1 Tax=Arcicella gelida TaxID=2984195 RepID=A0ABU5S6H9_9BACT|nr:GtrA family protein [Arcicella sp. DC2W]MEA5404078.1 GtrA family protein [Arcicella sp. DC2W]